MIRLNEYSLNWYKRVAVSIVREGRVGGLSRLNVTLSG